MARGDYRSSVGAQMPFWVPMEETASLLEKQAAAMRVYLDAYLEHLRRGDEHEVEFALQQAAQALTNLGVTDFDALTDVDRRGEAMANIRELENKAATLRASIAEYKKAATQGGKPPVNQGRGAPKPAATPPPSRAPAPLPPRAPVPMPMPSPIPHEPMSDKPTWFQQWYEKTFNRPIDPGTVESIKVGAGVTLGAGVMIAVGLLVRKIGSK